MLAELGDTGGRYYWFWHLRGNIDPKPLIPKMHTEPEILNRGIEGYDAGYLLAFCDSLARHQIAVVFSKQPNCVATVRRI